MKNASSFLDFIIKLKTENSPIHNSAALVVAALLAFVVVPEFPSVVRLRPDAGAALLAQLGRD